MKLWVTTKLSLVEHEVVEYRGNYTIREMFCICQADLQKLQQLRLNLAFFSLCSSVVTDIYQLGAGIV